jgi:hypothetical protein
VVGEIDIEWKIRTDLMLYENLTREVDEVVILDSSIYNITLIDENGNEFSDSDHKDLIVTATKMLYNVYDKTVLADIVNQHFYDGYTKTNEDNYHE